MCADVCVCVCVAGLSCAEGRLADNLLTSQAARSPLSPTGSTDSASLPTSEPERREEGEKRKEGGGRTGRGGKKVKQFRSDRKMPPIGEGRREGSEPGGSGKKGEFLKRGMECWGEERGVVIRGRVQAEGRNSKVEGKKEICF